MALFSYIMDLGELGAKNICFILVFVICSFLSWHPVRLGIFGQRDISKRNIKPSDGESKAIFIQLAIGKLFSRSSMMNMFSFCITASS